MICKIYHPYEQYQQLRQRNCSIASQKRNTLDVKIDARVAILQPTHNNRAKRASREIGPYLEALDDAGHDLVLEPRVLPLGVLPDDDDVDVLVPGGEAGEVGAVDERGVEVELLAKLHVEGGDPAADGGGEAALEAHLVAADGLDDGGRHGGHVAADLVGLEVDRRVHHLHHLLHGPRHERPDPVPRDQRHGARVPVPWPGHVGHRAARAGAAMVRRGGGGGRRGGGEDAAEEGGGSPRHGWEEEEANCDREGGGEARRGGREERRKETGGLGEGKRREEEEEEEKGKAEMCTRVVLLRSNPLEIFVFGELHFEVRLLSQE